MRRARRRRALKADGDGLECPRMCGLPDRRIMDATSRFIRRPRLLLIAEGCNPEMTSVPLEGYSHCQALRQLTEALVLTHWRNRAALLKAGWIEGRDFSIIDTEWAARRIWKLTELLRGGQGTGWTTVAALAAPLYYLFER